MSPWLAASNIKKEDMTKIMMLILEKDMPKALWAIGLCCIGFVGYVGFSGFVGFLGWLI